MNVMDNKRLACELVEAAAQAMATLDGGPPTDRVLQAYRGDAKAIATAVIVRLAGSSRASGFPKGALVAKALAFLAEEMRKL
ncbi:hypothetical protein [Acidisoma silvae]|uniref:Uncharacterized protein n=1 Tax=Acidisoma silvae TaxID=2802396 RepID=A0A964E0P4_9PROT|nr:hypothetical protein [Acidisoma silvae]MCB8877382.1 hypothetical protein [Acidisoma silvae]